MLTFSITTERQKSRDGGQLESGADTTTSMRAKLHIVDLAGSERVKDSEVNGQDLRDACKINLSLFHLASVVAALSKDRARGKQRGSSTKMRGHTSRPRHVPYKNDKLCFLLRDALGGNCRTVLIATVSPSQVSSGWRCLSLATHFLTACEGAADMFGLTSFKWIGLGSRSRVLGNPTFCSRLFTRTESSDTTYYPPCKFSTKETTAFGAFCLVIL